MATIIGFDAETSSTVDLPRLGADVYTRDPNTRCLMFVYHQTNSNQPYRLWLEGQPPPTDFLDYAQNGCSFSGWNVIGFDRGVYNRILVTRHGFPPIDDDRWLDSMHLAAHANLPRSLAGAGRAVGIPFQESLKDSNRLRRITNANRTPIPAPVAAIMAEPERFDRGLVDDLHWLIQRCLQDVPMEEQILARLPPWPTTEPWLAMPAIDRRINDRGVFIDVPLVQGLAKAAALELHRSDGVMAEVTDGQVKKCTEVEKLKIWLVGNGVELPPNEPPKDEDEEREDDQNDKEAEKDRKSPWRLRKSDLADLLAKTDIPDKCHEALALRAEAAKVSVHKLQAMLRRVASDGRIYQAFSLGGAQATMRWSSGGVQLQNYVRDTYANFEEIATINGLDAKRDKEEVGRLRDIALDTAIKVGRTGDPELMRCIYQMQKIDLQGRSYTQGVLLWISRMLRATLCVPEGHMLLNGDYSNIEARIPVWLAGQEDVVGQFARGEDVYRHRAAPIYGKPPEALSREERQIGKVTTLFCGFGAGPRAFVPAAMNYGITVSLDAGAQIIKTFRDTNTALVRFWDANLRCALEAIRDPGREFQVPPKGLVSWKCINKCLMCRLPSGRILRYRGAHLVQSTWPDGRPKAKPEIRVLVVKGKVELPRTLWRGLACLSAQSKVITRQGVKNLLDVSLDDELWDGTTWVKHDGVVYQGIKETISFGGVRMTPDHKVDIDGKWRECGSATHFDVVASYARHYQSPNWDASSDQTDWPQRTREGYLANTLRLWQRKTNAAKTVFGRWRSVMRVRLGRTLKRSETRTSNTWDVETSGIRSMAFNERSVPVADTSSMEKLWRSRHYGLSGMARKFRNILAQHGTDISTWVNDRTTGQQLWLRFYQLLLGYPFGAKQQPAQQCLYLDSLGRTDSCSSSSQKWYRGDNLVVPVSYELSVKAVIRQTRYKEPVFDILNAGPRRRFTVVGENNKLILVSNCENLTQAIAADMLGIALVNMENIRLPVVLHCHDSLAAEVRADQAEQLLPWFKDAMLAMPAWTNGLPVAAEVHYGARFA